MATNAKLSGPTSLCISSNSDLYFVDGLNKRIRKVDSFGIITTIAGNGNSIFNGDGISATSAQIAPLGLPDFSGIELITRIRKANIKVPILILTARSRSEEHTLNSSHLKLSRMPSSA